MVKIAKNNTREYVAFIERDVEYEEFLDREHGLGIKDNEYIVYEAEKESYMVITIEDFAERTGEQILELLSLI